MAIGVAALSLLLGFTSFLTALLVLDYSFLLACALYLAVANGVFVLTISWAWLSSKSSETDTSVSHGRDLPNGL